MNSWLSYVLASLSSKFERQCKCEDRVVFWTPRTRMMGLLLRWTYLRYIWSFPSFTSSFLKPGLFTWYFLREVFIIWIVFLFTRGSGFCDYFSFARLEGWFNSCGCTFYSGDFPGRGTLIYYLCLDPMVEVTMSYSSLLVYFYIFIIHRYIYRYLNTVHFSYSAYGNSKINGINKEALHSVLR